MGQTVEITAEMMSNAQDHTLVSNLSREIYGLLYLKTRRKARAPVEHLEVHRGPNAYEQPKNLVRLDAKKLKIEYDQRMAMDPVKDSDMRLIGTLASTWHAESSSLGKTDGDYVCGKHQRRQILFKALPADVRTPVEKRKPPVA